MKSTPFRSPWGLNKVRMERRTLRLRFLEKRPRKSPMTMQYFDKCLDRFSMNWDHFHRWG